MVRSIKWIKQPCLLSTGRLDSAETDGDCLSISTTTFSSVWIVYVCSVAEYFAAPKSIDQSTHTVCGDDGVLIAVVPKWSSSVRPKDAVSFICRRERWKKLDRDGRSCFCIVFHHQSLAWPFNSITIESSYVMLLWCTASAGWWWQQLMMMMIMPASGHDRSFVYCLFVFLSLFCLFVSWLVVGCMLVNFMWTAYSRSFSEHLALAPVRKRSDGADRVSLSLSTYPLLSGTAFVCFYTCFSLLAKPICPPRSTASTVILLVVSDCAVCSSRH